MKKLSHKETETLPHVHSKYIAYTWFQPRNSGPDSMVLTTTGQTYKTGIFCLQNLLLLLFDSTFLVEKGLTTVFVAVESS